MENMEGESKEMSAGKPLGESIFCTEWMMTRSESEGRKQEKPSGIIRRILFVFIFVRNKGLHRLVRVFFD